MEPEHAWSLEPLVAEVRADVRHLQTDISELRQDVRLQESRFFQLLLVQLATLATALGSLAATLLA